MAEPSINSGARLLVLDGDRSRGEELVAALSQLGYNRIDVAAGIDEAAGRFDQVPPELVLADLDVASAAEAVTALRGMGSAHVPLRVLGLTSDATSSGRNRAAALGADDVAIRPLQGDELQMRVTNALGAARLRRLLTDRSARLTEAMRDHSAEVGVVRESLSLLAAIADFHDDDTDQHAHRVGTIAVLIARALALPESFVMMLGDAAPLHDIGKVGISRRILLKPGALTESERAHMMQHVDVGGQILASAQSDVLVLAAEIARTHHERFDGSGYTAGLAGEEIPLSGRIVAVADVWDTLTHQRPYREAWEPERALTEIYEQSGSHFDPRVVEAFSSLDHLALAPRAASGASAA